MRPLLIFLLLISSVTAFSQYKVDSIVKNKFFKILDKLPHDSKEDIATKYKGYEEGMGLFYDYRTDTLNKKDFKQYLNNVEVYDIDPTTGKVDKTKPNSIEQEQISKDHPLPFPLFCNCSFKNDTLTIISGIYLYSGFFVTTKLHQGKVKALYSESESAAKVLQPTLEEEKANRITIPATVNFLNLDRRPTANIKELFGEISVTTNGYYSYMDVGGFKNGYINKRMKFQFYFHCNMKSRAQE